MNLADEKVLRALNALLAGIHESTHHAGDIASIGVDDLLVALDVLQELPGYVGRAVGYGSDGRARCEAWGRGEHGVWQLVIAEGEPIDVHGPPSTPNQRPAAS